MSPEMLMQEGEYGFATDMYSLAIILFEMVCGRNEFHALPGEYLLSLIVY